MALKQKTRRALSEHLSSKTTENIKCKYRLQDIKSILEDLENFKQIDIFQTDEIKA